MLIEEILSEGKRNQTTGLDQALEMALQDANRLEEVAAFLFSAKPNVAARAAWVLRNVAETDPDLVFPHKEYIIEHLSRELIWEVRSELCHVLPKMTFTEEELVIVTHFFEEGLQNSSRIVATWSLQGLFELSKKYGRPDRRIYSLIEEALQHESPAVRARARAIEREIKKMNR